MLAIRQLKLLISPSSLFSTRNISNVSKNFLLARSFEGEIKETDFKLVEEELPELKNGEFKTEGLYWSVDPYMRAYVTLYKTPINTVMFGGQIGRVIESRSDKFKVGEHVYGHFGWRTLTNVNVTETKEQFYKLPDLQNLPLSIGLGACGMTGVTAYYGLLDVCKPNAGETVAISGAAGAVGSIVGQIAKIKGCKVIGIAGSDDKLQWLKDELGFDVVINYKTMNVRKELIKNVPGGIDCYFDNVGGVLSSTILTRMNHGGRIAVCGSITSYNMNKALPEAPIVQPLLVPNELKMEGFLVNRWDSSAWQTAISQLAQWVAQKKIIARETVTEGFENIPKALIGLLRGDNTGKAIVKAVK